MTKKKDAKRSLLMSGLALVLCLVMLGGSSLAWYSDVVSAEQNKIETGVLDAQLLWAEGSEAVPTNAAGWTDASEGPIFDYDKWEPGYVEAKHIKMANTGTLEFKYRLNIVPNVALADGELNLADVIDVYFFDGGEQVASDFDLEVAAADTATYPAFKKVGALSDLMADSDGAAYGTLDIGETKTITIVLMMQNDALNEYQGLSVGEGFSIQLAVSQLTGEFVDPGDQTNYNNYSKLEDLSAATGNVSLATSDGVLVNVPDTLVADLSNDVTKIQLAHSEPVVDTVTNTVTFDSVELLDQNRDVIDLNGNIYELTITLPANGFVDGETVTIYHDGEEMGTTTVSNGMITYNVTHLCEILVVPYGCVAVTTADELMTALTGGQDAILLKDIVVPADTTITVGLGYTSALNLNGHTIHSTNTRTDTHNVLFDVNGGTLSISNGAVQYKHTGDNMEWNGAATVFNVTAGGVLNMDDVTVRNLGGTDMNFAVHLNNWGKVTLNADNCVFDAPYCGVRVFNSGYDTNNVTITNSKLTGATRAFWVHNYIGDLDSTQHSDEAIKERLKLDIYNNNNAFEITGEAESPIRYGFGTTVYFDTTGSQLVDDAAELQSAIDNGSESITLTDDIDLSDLGGLIIN